MAIATFETPDGEDIEIDGDDVARIRAGDEETAIIELEDGSEVIVVASELEAAAELGLDPLEVIDAEDDDAFSEELAEDDYGNEDDDR